jgi:hypothetical protein
MSTKNIFFHFYQFRSKNAPIDLNFFLSPTNTLNKNSCFEANHLVYNLYVKILKEQESA